ncbi:hypothetical protein TNCV_758281 [Trichonephila clavipes]|nr:hypothetical protein TNCV_758281 [Trichonephila clavipes]
MIPAEDSRVPCFLFETEIHFHFQNWFMELNTSRELGTYVVFIESIHVIFYSKSHESPPCVHPDPGGDNSGMPYILYHGVLHWPRRTNKVHRE